MTRPSRFAPRFKVRAINLYRFWESRAIADVAQAEESAPRRSVSGSACGQL